VHDTPSLNFRGRFLPERLPERHRGTREGPRGAAVLDVAQRKGM